MPDNRQFCTFYLNNYFFGIDVALVQEIIRLQDMTPVPLAPDVVGGLINLRGHIVTAIDLRKRLEFPARTGGQKSMNIVINIDHEIISFLVDEIGDVLTLSADAFEEPPKNLNGNACELITGTYKLKDRLLLILDAYKTVALTTEAAV